MTGDIGEGMIVRFEGKSRGKGNTKKFNRSTSYFTDKGILLANLEHMTKYSTNRIKIIL